MKTIQSGVIDLTKCEQNDLLISDIGFILRYGKQTECDGEMAHEVFYVANARPSWLRSNKPSYRTDNGRTIMGYAKALQATKKAYNIVKVVPAALLPANWINQLQGRCGVTPVDVQEMVGNRTSKIIGFGFDEATDTLKPFQFTGDFTALAAKEMGDTVPAVHLNLLASTMTVEKLYKTNSGCENLEALAEKHGMTFCDLLARNDALLAALRSVGPRGGYTINMAMEVADRFKHRLLYA